jgi:hypothetical protein
MPTFAVNPFARRQVAKSRFSHFAGTDDYLSTFAEVHIFTAAASVPCGPPFQGSA